MNTIKIARLNTAAILPTRKNPQDAGLDIYACQETLIPAHTHGITPTGITMEIPQGYVAILKPKGRNNHLLGAGVVDAGYQGEILVKIFNPTNEPLLIRSGDAIGQILIIPILTPAVEEVSLESIHILRSTRGDSGGIVEQHHSQ